jgi:hypothetical protein
MHSGYILRPRELSFPLISLTCWLWLWVVSEGGCKFMVIM